MIRASEQASGAGPIPEFCAALRRLQESCQPDRAALARRLKYSRSQLYAILDGRIRRPPEWDRLVEPLVRICTDGDEHAIGVWRRRHDVLVGVDSELRRQSRQDSTSGPAPVSQVFPAQLPANVDVFTGRTAELAELDRLLAGSTGQNAAAVGGSTAVVISAVSGTAGVGKTALALRWAHRVRGEFPHGQLYVNLRGYDPDQPLSAGDALAGFLRALGVPGQDIPLQVDERAALYRSLLDGRRILVMLDNAGSVEQIRPLLPGAPSCLVVVTSRDSLTGLVARHGARRLDLDLLPADDAVALLRALIGNRVDTEPAAAVTLAGQCAHLPLALRVAAELAAARPAISLAGLVAELADERRRLELLDAGGDPRTAVRSVFAWSYRHLPVDAARVFRLLGLHPGPDLDSYAAAALAGTGLERARQLLDLLACGHLIQLTGLGRYGMHDLLRAYATHLATTEDSEEERRAVLTQLFDYYLATAATAMDILLPAEQRHRPRIPPPAMPTPPLPDPTAARAWLDTERDTLVAVTAHTAVHGWPGHTTQLATTLFRYLDTGGHHPDALIVHTHARHAACHHGDPVGEAHALTSLGVVYWRQGRYQQAAEHLQQAAVLYGEVGDRAGEARSLGNLGHLYWRQGRYDHAAEFNRQALELSREIGHQSGAATALDNLGAVYRQQGHYSQAVDHHQQALELSREIGHRSGEATASDNLGAVYRQQGHYQQAVDHHQHALALFREIGDRNGEAEALNGHGETLHAIGQLGAAFIQHTAALELATEIGDRYEQARAQHGLGRTHHASGDLEQARHHWRAALAVYTDLGVPEADDVHVHLATLDQTADTC